MKISIEKLHILWNKYGIEKTDSLFSHINNSHHIEILIDRLNKMNLLYDDAVLFVQMYLKEIHLLNFKRLLNNTCF